MQPEILHVDEIQADVECLMCARVIGQLFGHRWRTNVDGPTARTIANLTTYCANEPGVHPRPVLSRERFGCPNCGGRGYVGEISARTLIDKVPSYVCPMHTEPKTGPGRPATGCRCHPSRIAA